MADIEKRYTFGWYGVGYDSPCTDLSFYNEDMSLIEGFENVRSVTQSSGTITIAWSADLDRSERKRWKEIGKILEMYGMKEKEFIPAKQLLTKFECGNSYLIELKRDGKLKLENFKPSYYKQGGTDFVLAPTKPTCQAVSECECNSHVFQFRKIARPRNRYWGWEADELWELCLLHKDLEGQSFGFSIKLYYATDDLEVDTELYLDKHPTVPEFTIKREKDPWVWSDTTEKFYRLENNKIVEIVSCPDIAPVDCVEQSWDGISWQPCEDEDENVVTCGDDAKRKRTRGINIPAKNNGKECEGPFEQEEDCNLPDCPTDCVPEDWEGVQWSACSKPCNDGTPGKKTRTRGIKIPAKDGGDPCKASDLTETELCNTDPCPVDCVVSDWIKAAGLDADGWSECSKPCNDGTSLGTQKRTRTELVPTQHDGAACPVLEETRTCNDIECPIDCEPATEWNGWSECTTPCHSGETNAEIGSRSRTRNIAVQVQHGGKECSQQDVYETESCGQDPCPINCEVNDWLDWSGCVFRGRQLECMREMPPGRRPLSTRIRTVKTPPNSTGIKCPHLSEARECIPASVAAATNPDPSDFSVIDDCPVDCVMSPWVWDVCRDGDQNKVTCGRDHTRKATRKIITPAKFGGLVCGDTEKTESCDPILPECSTDVDGDEILCVDLTFGKQHSMQSVLEKFIGTYEQSMDESEWKHSHPIWKHKHHPGYTIEASWPDPLTWVLKLGGYAEVAAATDAENSPHSPNIGSWRVSSNGWDTYINSVVISNGGCADVNCEMNDWSSWDPEECPCGGGTQVRTRTIKTDPKYAGTPCGVEKEIHECEYTSCEVDCSTYLCVLNSGERAGLYRDRNDRNDLVNDSMIDGKYNVIHMPAKYPGNLKVDPYNYWPDGKGRTYWQNKTYAWHHIKYLKKGESMYRWGKTWDWPMSDAVMALFLKYDKNSTRFDKDMWVIGSAMAAQFNMPDVYYYTEATSAECPPAGKVWLAATEWPNVDVPAKYSDAPYTSDTVQLARAQGELAECNVTFSDKMPCDLIDLGRAEQFDYKIVALTLDFDYDVDFSTQPTRFFDHGDFASWNTDGLATGPTQTDRCPYFGTTSPRVQQFRDYHFPCTPTCAQYGSGRNTTTFIRDHKNTHARTPPCHHDLWRAVQQAVGTGVGSNAQTSLVSEQVRYEEGPKGGSSCGSVWGQTPYSTGGCGGVNNDWKYFSCSHAIGYVGWNNIPGYGAWCKGSWNTFLEVKLKKAWDIARIHAQFALGNGHTRTSTSLKTEVYGKDEGEVRIHGKSREDIPFKWITINAYDKNSFHDPKNPTSEYYVSEPTMAKDIIALEVTKIRFTGTGGWSATGARGQGQNNNGQFALQLLRLEARDPVGCSAGKVDCIKGNSYSQWGDCRDDNNEVVTCGTGTQARTLDEIVPAMFGGDACANMTQTQQCVLPECPVDCEGAWTGWSACANDRGTLTGCGEGKKFDTFIESQSATGGGRACKELFDAEHGDIKEQMCGDKCSPVTIDCGVLYKHLGVLSDGVFTYTLNFAKAKYTLGKVSVILNPKGGTENFKITYGGKVVVNETISAKKTVTFDINGSSKIANVAVTSYSTLTEWEIQAVCPTPIDCASHWGGWGACHNSDVALVTCGGGIKTRVRVIDVQPLGGTACGPETESVPCNVHPCPKDCEPESEFTYSGCQLGQSIVVAAGNNFSSGPWNVWRMHDRYSNSGFDTYANETPLTGYVDRLGGRNHPTPKLIRGSLYDAFWINPASHLGGFAIHTDNTIYVTDASWGHLMYSGARDQYAPLWEGKIQTGGKYEWRKIGKWDPTDVVTSGQGTTRNGWRTPTGVTVALNGMVYVVDNASSVQTGKRLLNGTKEMQHMWGVMRRVFIPNDPDDVNRIDPVNETIIKEGFSSPDSIAVDKDHTIYILDSFKTKWGFKGLLKMTRKENGYEWNDPIHLWDYPGNGLALDVAVDLNNILYVTGKEGVYKMNNEGGGVWKIHAGSFAGVSVDGAGNVYLMASYGANPSILKPNGSGGYISKVEEFACHGGVCKGPVEPLNSKSFGTNCCPWGETSAWQPARVRVPLVDPEEEVSCGNQYGLVKTGTRGIKKPKVGSGKDCTGLTTVTECDGDDIQPCKIDCTGIWGEWGSCLGSNGYSLEGGCGSGNKHREYFVTQFNQGAGGECPQTDGDIGLESCTVDDMCCDCGHPEKNPVVAVHEQGWMTALEPGEITAGFDNGNTAGKYGVNLGHSPQNHTFKSNFYDLWDNGGTEIECTDCKHYGWGVPFQRWEIVNWSDNKYRPSWCPVTSGNTISESDKEEYWFLDKFPVQTCGDAATCRNQTIGGDGFHGSWWAQGCTKYDDGNYYMAPCGNFGIGDWTSLSTGIKHKIDTFGNKRSEPYQHRVVYELDRRINISRIEVEFDIDFRGYPNVLNSDGTKTIGYYGGLNGWGYTTTEGEEPVESRERFYGKMAGDPSLKTGLPGGTSSATNMLKLMQKYNISPGTTNPGAVWPLGSGSGFDFQSSSEFVKWRVIAHGTGHDVNADHGRSTYRVDEPCHNISENYYYRSKTDTSCAGVPDSDPAKPYGSIELGHGIGPGIFELVGCDSHNGCTFEKDDGSYDDPSYGHVGLKEVLDDTYPTGGKRSAGWETRSRGRFDKLGKSSSVEGIAPSHLVNDRSLYDDVWANTPTNPLHQEYGNENRWKQFIGTSKWEEPQGSAAPETTRNDGHSPWHTDRIEIVFWHDSAHDNVWKAGVKSIKVWGIESCLGESGGSKHDWRQDHVAINGSWKKLWQLPNPWASPTKGCSPSTEEGHPDASERHSS